MRRWDAVGVLIDDQLVVGAIDRVVQHGWCRRISTFSSSATDRYSVSAFRILAGAASPDVFFAAQGGVSSSQGLQARS